MADLQCEIKISDLDEFRDLLDSLISNFDELPDAVKVALAAFLPDEQSGLQMLQNDQKK